MPIRRIQRRLVRIDSKMMIYALILLSVTSPIVQAKTQYPGASAVLSPDSDFDLVDDQAPSIGIEELFRDFERPGNEEPKIQVEPFLESSFGTNDITNIQPSSVVRTEQLKALVPSQRIGVNSVIIHPPKETVQIVEPTQVHQESAKTRVQSSTIFSNFVDGFNSVGLVTSTGNTLIANGVTTINIIRVFGTYLAGGQYAQVIQSSAEVFEDEIAPTASGFAGTVQYVSEKPSFGVEVAGISDQKPKKRENQDLAGLFQEGSEPQSTTGSRLQQTQSQKEAANNNLRERLKNRFQKFKAQVNAEDEIVGRGSVSQIDAASLRTGKAPAFQRERSKANKLEAVVEEEETEVEEIEETDRSGSQRALSAFGSNRRNFREPPSSASRSRNRINNPTTDAPRRNTGDLTGQASIQHETVSSDFASKKRNNPFRDRNAAGVNRFRQSQQTTSPTPTTTPQSEETGPRFTNPDLVRSIHSLKAPKPHNEILSQDEPVTKPNIVLKSFNRFSRPDIRKSLLDKILGKGGKGEHTLDPEEVKAHKEAEAEKEAEALKESAPSFVDSNDLSDEDKLQTTLHVSTIHPTTLPSTEFFEVATIRSPYSFDFEESKSTRYITVTRTFTSKVSESISSTIAPSSVEESKSPLFKTETIPPPENILASTATPFETSILEISSGIETLPAVVIESSTSSGTPPLKTITETFSTRELTLKTSVLPIVVNGRTSLHTLTQSYYVTKLIEAVKTLPPTENYEFVATQAFKDFSNVLEEAGSEKREQLLPGELEFSDQDNFDVNGPKEIRVPPPEGFEDDLKILGTKFDSDLNEKKVEELVAIQSSIEPSQVNPVIESQPPSQTTVTPTLPQFNPLANFTPEQIQQLALLQYLQNLGGFQGIPSFPSPFSPQQDVITSTPVYKTETLFATSTIPLFLGAKKFFTTLTQSIGVTTVTDYETVTISPNPQENPLSGIFGQPNPAAALAPALIETSQAVVVDTVVPSTIYKEIKITFRNSPTVTTLTSTTMVSTQITSYVTKTVRAQPTLSPFNPFAAFG